MKCEAFALLNIGSKFKLERRLFLLDDFSDNLSFIEPVKLRRSPMLVDL